MDKCEVEQKRARTTQEAAQFPISSPIPDPKLEAKKPIPTRKIEVEMPKVVLASIQVCTKPEIWKTHQPKKMSKRPSSCK